MAVLNGIQGLVLPLPGTVIDRRRGLTDALGGWAAHAGLAADVDALVAQYDRLEADHARAEPAIPDEELRMAAFGDLARAHGVPADAGEAEAFADSADRWPLFPEAAAALDALAARHRLALIADAERASWAVWAKHLPVTPEVVVTVEDAGARTPDPAPIREALDGLSEIGIGMDAIALAGHDRARHLAPAAALGVPAIWVRRGAGATADGVPVAAEVRDLAALGGA